VQKSGPKYKSRHFARDDLSFNLARGLLAHPTGMVRFARRTSGPPRKALGCNIRALPVHLGPEAHSPRPQDHRDGALCEEGRRPDEQSSRVQYPRKSDPPGARVTWFKARGPPGRCALLIGPPALLAKRSGIMPSSCRPPGPVAQSPRRAGMVSFACWASGPPRKALGCNTRALLICPRPEARGLRPAGAVRFARRASGPPRKASCVISAHCQST
jgi:hypothetical protein